MTSISQLRALWASWSGDELPSPDARVVPVRQRVLAAIAVGLGAGIFCWACSQRVGATPDFAYPMRAARYFLSGGNPYAVFGGGIGADADAVLIFPFTTVLFAVPFAWLTAATGTALFFGVSAALLAFVVTRDGLWRLHLFASGPFVISAVLGQFAPLLMVLAFAPAAGFLAVLKPNLGLALLVRRPSVRAVVGCLIFVAISLIIFPRWPFEWRHALQINDAETAAHLIPVRQLGGVLLLLSLLALRLPSGRLLAAMSVIPQVMLFYDALPLWLVPRTRKQSIVLTACSQAAVVAWFLLARPGEVLLLSAVPFVLWLIYVPTLALVLTQRFAGEAWLASALGRRSVGRRRSPVASIENDGNDRK